MLLVFPILIMKQMDGFPLFKNNFTGKVRAIISHSYKLDQYGWFSVCQKSVHSINTLHMLK